ncbi:MAG: hypothetical protein JWN48_3977 [Myxococcaceae bacterium]|nr:hypothetical protein [Myxococcaceae bacterium]
MLLCLLGGGFFVEFMLYSIACSIIAVCIGVPVVMYYFVRSVIE